MSLQPQSQPGGSSSALDPDLQAIAGMLQLISDRVGVMIDNAKKKVEKLHQKNTSSDAVKLMELKAKCEELRMKVICVEGELGMCWDEIEVLKSDLKGERKGRQEAELKLTGYIQKCDKMIEEARVKNMRLEERVNSLEMMRPPPTDPLPTPSTSRTQKFGGTVITSLDSLSDETQTNGNGRQRKLEGEVGEIKEPVGNTSQSQNVASVTENADETSPSPSENPQLPPSSPSLDFEATAPFLVKVEAVPIKEESTISIVDTFSQTPPPTPTAPSPVADSVAVGPSDTFQFEEDNDDESFSPSLLAPADDIAPAGEDIGTVINDLIGIPPSTILNSTQIMSKRKAKWYMEHRPEESLEFTCVCDLSFKFKSEKNLDRHIKLYTQRHYFGCEICHRTFRYLSKLGKHLENCHDGAFLESNQVIGCATCGARLSSCSEFQVHWKNNCPIKVPSSSPDDADNDNPAHDQLGPVKVIIHGRKSEANNCEGNYSVLCYCGGQFDSWAAISKHFEYYTAECKWECKWQGCGRKFREKEELPGHMENEHKIRTLQRFFSQNASQHRSLHPEELEPTSSTDPPGTSPNQPVSQTIPTNEGKRTAQELPCESGMEGSSSAKRSRLNYPARRASKGTEKRSSSNNQ